MISARLGRALGAGRFFRQGTMWTLDWKDGQGRRRRQALSRDRRVAERMRIEIVHQRDLEVAGLSTVEGQSRPLADVRDAYLADLATRSCPRHVVNVTASLDRVLAAIPARRVRDVKPYDLIAFRADRLKAGISVRSANLGCDVLRSMLTWAVRVGLIAENPVKSMPGLKQTDATQVYRRRAMTEEEITRFLAAAQEDDRVNLERIAAVKTIEGGTKGVQWSLRRRKLRVPQAPLWRAFLETGCRYGELTQVAWADVDLDLRVLRLRAMHTKAGRAREIPLLESLVRDLRALRANHALVLGRPLRPNDPVFRSPEGRPWCRPTNNIMRVFDRLLDATGIDRVDAEGRKLDIHALRHSFASRLARKGVPLQQAQRILGHRDPKLTATIYSHLGVEDLRESIELLLHHPMPATVPVDTNLRQRVAQ